MSNAVRGQSGPYARAEKRSLEFPQARLAESSAIFPVRDLHAFRTQVASARTYNENLLICVSFD